MQQENKVLSASKTDHKPFDMRSLLASQILMQIKAEIDKRTIERAQMRMRSSGFSSIHSKNNQFDAKICASIRSEKLDDIVKVFQEVLKKRFKQSGHPGASKHFEESDLSKEIRILAEVEKIWIIYDIDGNGKID